jgi:hypothetical protein
MHAVCHHGAVIRCVYKAGDVTAKVPVGKRAGLVSVSATSSGLALCDPGTADIPFNCSYSIVM